MQTFHCTRFTTSMKHVCDVYVAFTAFVAFANVSSYDHAALVHALSLLDGVDAPHAFANAPNIAYANVVTCS